jgi:hypothetical protein
MRRDNSSPEPGGRAAGSGVERSIPVPVGGENAMLAELIGSGPVCSELREGIGHVGGRNFQSMVGIMTRAGGEFYDFQDVVRGMDLDFRRLRFQRVL